MTSSPSNRLLFAFILSASLASTIGGLPFNVLPVMLGSLADSFKLDAQTTGMIGSVCFAGYLVGTLGAPFWMNRVNWRILTIVSAMGTAASFAASSQIDTLEWLVVVWALIGFFASTMTCLGMRILSDLPDKALSCLSQPQSCLPYRHWLFLSTNIQARHCHWPQWWPFWVCPRFGCPQPHSPTKMLPRLRKKHPHRAPICRWSPGNHWPCSLFFWSATLASGHS